MLCGNLFWKEAADGRDGTISYEIVVNTRKIKGKDEKHYRVRYNHQLRQFFGSGKNIGKFEEILSVANMLAILCLYMFGLLGVLKYGVAIFCVAVVGIYCYVLWLFVKEKETKWYFVQKFFTPSFVLYAFGLIVLIITLRGEMVYSRDEFSHWMDSVKAMHYSSFYIKKCGVSKERYMN